METCPNCARKLNPDFDYCPRCGQKAHLHRFSLHEIFHEAFHAVTHADKGILLLIKNLAIQPGVVAREYVLEGKRKRYFNPFTFLALVLGFILTVNAFIHPYTRDTVQAAATTTAPKSATEAEQDPHYRAAIARRDTFFNFLEKRANLVILFSIPIVALVYWLFFRRSHVNYAEFLVAQVLFSGFSTLLITVLLTPLLYFFSSGFWYNGIQLLFQWIYLSVAYWQFLALRRPQSMIKTSMATFLALLVWAIVSTGGGFVYIAYGGF